MSSTNNFIHKKTPDEMEQEQRIEVDETLDRFVLYGRGKTLDSSNTDFIKFDDLCDAIEWYRKRYLLMDRRISLMARELRRFNKLIEDLNQVRPTGPRMEYK